MDFELVQERMPEEMGTYEMFLNKPLEVWKWFLYRFNICSKALPNTGHFAIKELEDTFTDVKRKK